MKLLRQGVAHCVQPRLCIWSLVVILNLMVVGKQRTRLLQHIHKDIGTVFSLVCIVEMRINLDRLAQFLYWDTAQGRVVLDGVLRQYADIVGFLKNIHNCVDIINQ